MKKKVLKKKIKKLKKTKKKLEAKLAKKLAKKAKKTSKKKLKNKAKTTKPLAKPKTKKVKSKKLKSKKVKPKSSAKKSKKSKASKFSKDVQGIGAQVVSKAEEISSKLADDLKKIKGIGPVFEKRLIDLGIKTFEDMANLSQEIIEDVATKIKLNPERIIKEHWKEQAEDLLKETGTEDDKIQD